MEVAIIIIIQCPFRTSYNAAGKQEAKPADIVGINRRKDVSTKTRFSPTPQTNTGRALPSNQLGTKTTTTHSPGY